MVSLLRKVTLSPALIFKEDGLKPLEVMVTVLTTALAASEGFGGGVPAGVGAGDGFEVGEGVGVAVDLEVVFGAVVFDGAGVFEVMVASCKSAGLRAIFEESSL